jgi:hypothetical protein
LLFCVYYIALKQGLSKDSVLLRLSVTKRYLQQNTYTNIYFSSVFQFLVQHGEESMTEQLTSWWPGSREEKRGKREGEGN